MRQEERSSLAQVRVGESGGQPGQAVGGRGVLGQAAELGLGTQLWREENQEKIEYEKQKWGIPGAAVMSDPGASCPP